MAKLSGNATPEIGLVRSTSPLTDADVRLFAEFVDRALADVRQVILEEHKRLMKVNDFDALTSRAPTEANQVHLLIDSGQKSPHMDNTLASAIKTAPELKLDSKQVPSGEDDNSERKKATASRTLSPSKVNDAPVHEATKITKKSMTTATQLADIFTEDSRARMERKRELSTYAWKRVLIRIKQDPLELIDAVMSFVIIANAIAIGLSCDTKDWKDGWLVVDSTFAGIFILESCAKVYVLGFAGYLWGRMYLWAWFELALIVLSIVEIVATVLMTDSSSVNGVSVFRVLRLIRLTKLLRLCRVNAAADLVMMVNGLIGGLRTFCWAIVLLLLPLSVFALVMRETLGEKVGIDNGDENFNTLTKSYFTSFRCLVVGDCGDSAGLPIFVQLTNAHGWGYGFLYSFTVLFMQFGLYNVIIAIFVEQTVAAAKYNEVYKKRERLNDEHMFREKSLEMAELAFSLKKGIPQELVARDFSLNEIQGLELTHGEFNDLCKHEDFKEILSTLDVAEEDHLDLFDTLDVDGGGTLDLGEIVSGIGKLRGDARKSDIVACILLAKHLSRSLVQFKEDTEEVMEGQKNQLLSIQRALQGLALQQQQRQASVSIL